VPCLISHEKARADHRTSGLLGAGSPDASSSDTSSLGNSPLGTGPLGAGSPGNSPLGSGSPGNSPLGAGSPGSGLLGAGSLGIALLCAVLLALLAGSPIIPAATAHASQPTVRVGYYENEVFQEGARRCHKNGLRLRVLPQAL